MLTLILIAAAGVLVAGGSVFYVLAAVAAARYAGRPPLVRGAATPRLSVLKPLAGVDEGLDENLSSFQQVDYPDFELLFGVREGADPAAAVARGRGGALIVAGEPPSLEAYPNAKNWSLIQMGERATGEILVISDSDIRVAPDTLEKIAADFADPHTGVVTCPYRAVAGPSVWSRLEAIGMNTEFWSGVFTAAMLGPMDFAVGPTMAIRRECLAELGGFEATRDYLAEDFVLGNWAQRRGWAVRLSSARVEHRIGAQGFAANFAHRLRWYRSTRRSRPAGYVSQVFTYPLPFAVGLAALTGGAGWALGLGAACVLARIAAGWSTARALGTRLTAGDWALLPVQDVLSFVVWLLAFFGSTVVWRGRRFRLTREGRLEAVG